MNIYIYIYIYMYKYFFQNFSSSRKEGRKNNEEKKNVVVQNRLGYCPIVLQKGKDFVLQYNHCIAEI